MSTAEIATRGALLPLFRALDIRLRCATCLAWWSARFVTVDVHSGDWRCPTCWTH